jgi:hypothetical protein
LHLEAVVAEGRRWPQLLIFTGYGRAQTHPHGQSLGAEVD